MLKDLQQPDLESSLLSELESLGDAFVQLQKQNSELLHQINCKDETIVKLSSEKLNSEFHLAQVQRETDLMKQRSLKIEHDAIRAAEEAELKYKNTRNYLEAFEKQYFEKSSECEKLKWKLSDLNRQLSEIKIRYDTLLSKMKDPAFIDQAKALENAMINQRRLEEKLIIADTKIEAYKRSVGGAFTKDIEEELSNYKVNV